MRSIFEKVQNIGCITNLHIVVRMGVSLPRQHGCLRVLVYLKVPYLKVLTRLTSIEALQAASCIPSHTLFRPPNLGLDASSSTSNLDEYPIE